MRGQPVCVPIRREEVEANVGDAAGAPNDGRMYGACVLVSGEQDQYAETLAHQSTPRPLAEAGRAFNIS